MVRAVIVRIVLAASLATAATACARAATPLAECLAAYADEQRFSGAVLVEQGGRTTTYVRGSSASAGSPPITTETRFNIGSDTKMFTAVGVMQLVEAKKVSLDDPIGRYVTELTPEASAVTVRQLLTHVSGLGDFFRPETSAVVQSAHSMMEMIGLISNERPAFTPGTRYSYSNTGYLLLGMLIERVSGMPYDDYVRRHVFKPAGMESTGLAPGPMCSRAVGLTAMRPETQARSGRPGQRTFGDPGAALQPSTASQARGFSAGGAFSTVTDLQRFFHALAEGRLVSRRAYAEMTAPHVVAIPATSSSAELDYGYGFGSGAYEGHRWFGHAGGLPGVNAEANMFPGDGTIAIVLSNRDPPAASQLYSDLKPLLFHPAALGSCSSTRTR